MRVFRVRRRNVHMLWVGGFWGDKRNHFINYSQQTTDTHYSHPKKKFAKKDFF